MFLGFLMFIGRANGITHIPQARGGLGTPFCRAFELHCHFVVKENPFCRMGGLVLLQNEWLRPHRGNWKGDTWTWSLSKGKSSPKPSFLGSSPLFSRCIVSNHGNPTFSKMAQHELGFWRNSKENTMPNAKGGRRSDYQLWWTKSGHDMAFHLWSLGKVFVGRYGVGRLEITDDNGIEKCMGFNMVLWKYKTYIYI